MCKNGAAWRAAFFAILPLLLSFQAIGARCSGELEESRSLCDGLGSAMCPEGGSIGVEAGQGGIDRRQHGELQNLIDRLKDLVDSLSDTVQALDSTAAAGIAQDRRRGIEISQEPAAPSPESSPSPTSDRVHPDQGGVSSSPIQAPTDSSTPQLDQGGPVSLVQGSNPDQSSSTALLSSHGSIPAKTRVVARYKPAWTDHFKFLSAIHIDAALSCLHILPHDHEDGTAKYIAVGDEVGHLYVFSYLGDLLVDGSGPYKAAITSMVSVVLRKNETLLVAGYSNGAVVAYKVWEVYHQGAAGSMEDWTSLRMGYSYTFRQGGVVAEVDDGYVGSPMQAATLELYRVGRMRYLLVADESGTIQVYRDNGTLYGSAKSPSRPLAFIRTSSTQRLLFLTATGAASLDLRTMAVLSSRCEGLQNSSLTAYAFDAAGRSKAYGVTEDGDLISVTLSGDTLHFNCHVRSKRKLGLRGRPFRLHGLKGYILIATPREVAIYNGTAKNSLTRSIFAASVDEISQSFVAASIAPAKQPLVVCDRDKLVVMGFGEGYVGMFRSGLPVANPGGETAKNWVGSLLVSAGTLALAWLWFVNRKRDQVKMVESLQTSTVTSLAAPSATAGTPAPSVGFGAASSATTTSSGESTGIVLRSFDRSGLAEQKKLLEETRRFVASPSRGVYGGGSGGAAGYGVGSVNLRTTTVEHY